MGLASSTITFAMSITSDFLPLRLIKVVLSPYIFAYYIFTALFGAVFGLRSPYSANKVQQSTAAQAAELEYKYKSVNEEEKEGEMFYLLEYAVGLCPTWFVAILNKIGIIKSAQEMMVKLYVQSPLASKGTSGRKNHHIVHPETTLNWLSGCEGIESEIDTLPGLYSEHSYESAESVEPKQSEQCEQEKKILKKAPNDDMANVNNVQNMAMDGNGMNKDENESDVESENCEEEVRFNEEDEESFMDSACGSEVWLDEKYTFERKSTIEG